jgi:hypothetical protein
VGSAVSIYGMYSIYGTTNFAVAFPGFDAFEWLTLVAIAAGSIVALTNFILMTASPENVYKERGTYVAKLRQKARQHKAGQFLMNQKLERMKNKLLYEKEPHCLEWWDGVMFDTFPGYVEKRSWQVYIRNFLKENDIEYTAVTCKD